MVLGTAHCGEEGMEVEAGIALACGYRNESACLQLDRSGSRAGTGSRTLQVVPPAEL